MYLVNSRCISLLLLFFFASKIQAQDFSFVYNNQNSIESIKHNSAFIPNDKFYFQSSVSSNFNSSNLSINRIFNKQENQINTVINLVNDTNIY
jgi:hypothetical protein